MPWNKGRKTTRHLPWPPKLHLLDCCLLTYPYFSSRKPLLKARATIWRRCDRARRTNRPAVGPCPRHSKWAQPTSTTRVKPTKSIPSQTKEPVAVSSEASPNDYMVGSVWPCGKGCRRLHMCVLPILQQLRGFVTVLAVCRADRTSKQVRQDIQTGWKLWTD